METPPPSGETSSPQEIVIPPEQMKPLGEALNSFVQEPLGQIRSSIDAVPSGFEPNIVSLMKKAETELAEFFHKLERAREVKAVLLEKSLNQYDLVFSDEESGDAPPFENPVTMDERITKAFSSGLNHRPNQSLQMLSFGIDILKRADAAQARQALSRLSQATTNFRGAKEVQITPGPEGPSYQVIKP